MTEAEFRAALDAEIDDALNRWRGRVDPNQAQIGVDQSADDWVYALGEYSPKTGIIRSFLSWWY